MTKPTKILIMYINRMPLLGGIFLLVGIFMAFVALSTKNIDDWSIYYIPFKLTGVILGYIFTMFWSPGIYVTPHFGEFTPSDEEKILNNLGMKYRNKLIMIIPSLIYIIADFFIGKSYYQMRTGYFDAYLGMVFIGFFIALTTGSGIKYLTAWINLKKNWKKEFRN